MSSALAKRLADKIAISAHGLHHERLASGRADEYATLIDAELAGVVGALTEILNMDNGVFSRANGMAEIARRALKDHAP